MKALFTLTPAEAKRLIAKAVVGMACVKNAYQHGRLAIANGTTNAFVVEELLGITVSKENYTAGVITAGRICVSDIPKIIKPYLFDCGRQVDTTIRDFVKDFTGSDVLIKGANAVDPQGIAGILVGSREGGTIGAVWSTLTSVGATLIVPVGLEKLVPYIPAEIGIDHFDLSLGMPSGVFAVTGADVVTEIQALDMLFDVKATLMAAGGTGGSEGSTTFAIDGEHANVEAAIAQIRKIKGEPAVPRSRRACSSCDKKCAYFEQ